ncbi:helix-turn-helix domain-containing protein [Roseospira visakhapatnamensis]|uniref:Transcriptional regulator with XRE-family HTH domain n=1 Tax=Roseospira visakhapatnamensis TaxID=390880 RepID=A0A7W6RHP2_9PROT|nr:helix-turn-helix transcriptional regulator [Roseospira visakhapatnamensis]MBB4268186.1 transcriptional regulator with XRE-family HTH domain [Roseospira visakhapatnamensis]
MPKPKPDPDFLRACGQRLDAARAATGLNDKDFCDAIGVTQSRYANWKAGSHAVPPDIAARMKQRFGITTDWIYTGDPSGLPMSLAGKVHRAAS